MNRDRGYRIQKRELTIKRRIADARMHGNVVTKVQHLNQKNWTVQEVEKVCGWHVHELGKNRPLQKCSNKNCFCCYGGKKEHRRKILEARRLAG